MSRESERDQPIDKIALTENAADYTKYVNTYGRVFYNPDLGGVTFINSASGFEVCFRGTALRAQVQTVASGGSYANGMFSVFVDGETDSEAKILKTERSVFHCRAGVKKQGFPHSAHCTESG